jgi:hypothetical protein
MEKHYIRLDKYLQKYCPTLVSFISLSESKWEEITQRFAERMAFIEQKTSGGNTIEVETTLYDLILKSETGNIVTKSFLSLIENTFKDIISIVPSQHYSEIRKSTMSLLSAFDPQRSNYLNPLGEFRAILSILKNSNNILKEIERPLPNGKTIDYCFADPSTREEILVEVTNIHFKEGKIKTESDLILFLSGRISDKINDKLVDLDHSVYKKQVHLLPVVWCDFEDIYKYQSTFDNLESKFETLAFCIMGQTPLGDGSYTFGFSTVKNSIESYNNSKLIKSGA